MEDISLLIEHFIEKFSGHAPRKVTGVTEEALAAMLRYPWPGNIRELEQCVRNCLVRGEYHPARPKELTDDSAKAWLAEAERGTLTADDLLTHYCRWVYRQDGTYEGTADRIGLDRRTVKRRIVDAPQQSME